MVSAPAMNNFGNLYLTLDRMTTPQQFLEGFLQEKTAAWAEARPHLTTVYAKYFAEPLSQRAERFMPREAVQAVIEDVKQSDSVASALHASISRAQTFALVIVLQRPARVGRSLALITSASFVGAQDSPGIHDVKSAEEKDGMSQTEMRTNHQGMERTGARISCSVQQQCVPQAATTSPCLQTAA